MRRLDCGMSLSRLSAYVDSKEENDPADGRLDAHIEQCPHCRNAISSLEEISQWGQELRQDADNAPTDRTWASELMTRLALPLKEGASIRIPNSEEATLAVTEAALRQLLRQNASTKELLVLSTTFDADFDEPEAPITASCEVAVRFGCSIPQVSEELRESVDELVRSHARRDVERIDINVVDVFEERDEYRS